MKAFDKPSIEHLNLLASDVTAMTFQPQRKEIEQFVRQVFADAYGADVYQFLPILLCLRDGGDVPHSALGLRPAQSGPLFLETYLDTPVEQAVARAFAEPVDRDAVMEVGNLAVVDRGGVRLLFSVLTAFLYSARYQWVVFTVGPLVANTFARLGLSLTDLGPAKPDRLSAAERLAWGTYYDQKPRVMAGRVADAYPFFQRQCLREHSLRQLWRQAECCGGRAA